MHSLVVLRARGMVLLFSTAVSCIALLVGCSTWDGEESDEFSTARMLCKALVNRYRAAKGVPLLLSWHKAHHCADIQAKNDSEAESAHASFGLCHESAQNECPGWPSGDVENSITQCLLAMYGEGPGGGHHDTMINGSYRLISCGFHRDQKGGVWMVQDYH